MLKDWLARRGVRWAAVAGLAVGLAGLAALALGSTAATRQATAQVRESNRMSDAWNTAFVRVTEQDEALQQYLHTGTERDLSSLLGRIGSAEPELNWIITNGDKEEDFQVKLMRHAYTQYENTLRGIATAGAHGDKAQVDAYVEPAALAFASLRRLALANVVRVQKRLNDYLAQVDARSQALKTVASIVFIVDLALFTVCTTMLVGYQRRVEQQAADSRHRSLHDAMTGLANRVLLWDRMRQALRLAARTGEAVGLLVIDLDRFKEINDTLGHHCGDLMLQRVAERLSVVVRASDTVARLGGDEFAILLQNVQSIEHAVEVADRVLGGIRQPIDLEGEVTRVGGSIGVALYPIHSLSPEELFRQADAAMYAAKRGRLGVCVYPPAKDPGGLADRSDQPDASDRARAADQPAASYPPGVVDSVP